MTVLEHRYTRPTNLDPDKVQAICRLADRLNQREFAEMFGVDYRMEEVTSAMDRALAG